MAKLGEQQVPAIEVTGWRGLITNMNPQLIPPGGTQVQVNIASTTPGQMDTRNGVRDVNFET